MAISAETFRNIGGFSEVLMPILEDVEISHRLRRAGYRLRMDPGLQVQHIFRHSLSRSLGNAVRKATYWTIYSLRNRDLLADSGTASRELKVNGLAWLLTATVGLFVLVSGQVRFILIVPLIEMLNVWMNRRLFTAFLRSKGALFALAAMLYYTLLYPAAIWMGAFNGLARHLAQRRTVNA
jgi:hypothetical protein